MQSTPKRVLSSLAVLFVAGTGLAATRVYFVEPKTVANEWTEADPNAYVGQTFVANVDSIAYIEWFVGELSAEGAYRFEIVDHITYELVCQGDVPVPTGGWQWVRCDSFHDGSRRFTKGRRYLLRVRHTAGDSVNFVYRTDNPYKYGRIEVGGGGWGQSEPVEFCDLAARVYGEMDTIGANWFGTNPYYPWDEQWWGPDDTEEWDGPQIWEDRAVAAGVGAVRFSAAWVWFTRNTGRPDSFNFDKRAEAYNCFLRLGYEMSGTLYSCDHRVSTRIDSTKPRGDGGDTLPAVPRDTFWSIRCPPRNLYLPVAHDSNYWARYVEATVSNYPDIHTWEVWNEPNLIFEYWMRPNTGHYGDSLSDREMCSLYIRLCLVADSVIKGVLGRSGDKVLVGSLGDLEHEGPSKVKGKQWLRWMYEIADSVFWDGVAFHYYDDSLLSTFEADAETLRAIMRENDDYGELWITETGWSSTGAGLEGQANAVARVFTSALASPTRPGGGYDRASWFCFRDTPSFPHGLMDTLMQSLKPSSHAFSQVASTFPGMRARGRYLLGDERDEQVRIYEFEDPGTGKRTWVGWKTGTSGEVEVSIPVRSDEVSAESLHYTGNEQTVPATPEVDGWLSRTLTPRPVFITETGEESRPDLVVDSVWTVPRYPYTGGSCTVYVRFSNQGSCSTRTGGPLADYPKTTARFYVNDNLAGERDYAPGIGVGETVTVGIPWTPNLAGQVLLRAAVNDDQAYVEESMDDNAGYRRQYVSSSPPGEGDR